MWPVNICLSGRLGFLCCFTSTVNSYHHWSCKDGQLTYAPPPTHTTIVVILTFMSRKKSFSAESSMIIFIILLLLCSHSPNDVPPEPQRNVSIAAVRGAMRPSNIFITSGPDRLI